MPFIFTEKSAGSPLIVCFSRLTRITVAWQNDGSSRYNSICKKQLVQYIELPLRANTDLPVSLLHLLDQYHQKWRFYVRTVRTGFSGRGFSSFRCFVLHDCFSSFCIYNHSSQDFGLIDSFFIILWKYKFSHTWRFGHIRVYLGDCQSAVGRWTECPSFSLFSCPRHEKCTAVTHFRTKHTNNYHRLVQSVSVGVSR